VDETDAFRAEIEARVRAEFAPGREIINRTKSDEEYRKRFDRFREGLPENVRNQYVESFEDYLEKRREEERMRPEIQEYIAQAQTNTYLG
jgi:hypothetical protein